MLQNLIVAEIKIIFKYFTDCYDVNKSSCSCFLLFLTNLSLFYMITNANAERSCLCNQKWLNFESRYELFHEVMEKAQVIICTFIC